MIDTLMTLDATDFQIIRCDCGAELNRDEEICNDCRMAEAHDLTEHELMLAKERDEEYVSVHCHYPNPANLRLGE